MHMANTCIPKDEIAVLRQVFDSLDSMDVEKDGEIELDEFLEQLDAKFNIKVSTKQMMEIMKQVDLDYDGKIQFSEFLIACCNKRLLLSDEHLKEAFKQIDSDGNGQITEDDLQTFMGEEALLAERGVAVTVLDDEACMALMQDFIASKPTLWNEDIGEP